jgi:hypothetical protein
METINVELEFCPTKEVFLCENVPLSLTAGELLKNFGRTENIFDNGGNRVVFGLFLDSKRVDKKLRLDEIVHNKDEIIRFKLAPKVIAG